jgi:hypothetical protein
MQIGDAQPAAVGAVAAQVYNRSGQLVLEHTDERPNFYQFVRGPLKGELL